MRERNANNRIIFLTTLSVYLGLVLVGGASPVLAQAALTSNFNVQDEIEVKDDLDDKPGGEQAEDFPAIFAQLLNDVKRAVDSGRISLPTQTDFVVRAHYRMSRMCSGTNVGSDISDLNLNDFIVNAINKRFESKINQTAGFEAEKSEKRANLTLEANRTDLTLKISFTKSDAKHFSEFLNQQFSLASVSPENALTKEIYESTKAAFENDQVVIVTRLPRGSLDALLKQDAKAER